jgi:hypothetical protein
VRCIFLTGPATAPSWDASQAAWVFRWLTRCVGRFATRLTNRLLPERPRLTRSHMGIGGGTCCTCSAARQGTRGSISRRLRRRTSVKLILGFCGEPTRRWPWRRGEVLGSIIERRLGQIRSHNLCSLISGSAFSYNLFTLRVVSSYSLVVFLAVFPVYR